MSHFITIVELDSAINESRSVAPPVNGVLSADLRAMADLYGRMIYEKVTTADLYAQSEHIRAAVLKWCMLSRNGRRRRKLAHTGLAIRPRICARSANSRVS